MDVTAVSSGHVNVADNLVGKWQKIVDVIAQIADVPAALIMRVGEDHIEVFKSSCTPENPYAPGEKADFYERCGLYCEHVIRTRDKLLVPDALSDDDWKENPDIELGMISYLGLPLFWPDQTPFGTICILDKKPNEYNDLVAESLGQFRELIESHLSLIHQNSLLTDTVSDFKRYREAERVANKALRATRKKLQTLNVQLDERIRERTRELEDTNLALAESESRYRAMMEAMDDAIYICSADFRIEYMNSAMLKMIGRDAVGEVCYKALYNRDKKCPWCVHNKIMNGEKVKYELVSPDGERVYNISNSPIFHEDGSASKLTVFRDTTEENNIKLQFHHAQKMDAVGKLAGGIAHDFNNQLTGILGYAGMLESKLEDPGQQRFARNIVKAVNRAAQLTRQLLAFSRKGKNLSVPVEVHNLVRDVVSMLERSIDKRIEMVQDLQADCAVTIGDPDQLQNAILNLAINARDAMPKGGKLTFRSKVAGLDKTFCQKHSFDIAPGYYVCLTVMDTGTGMSREIQQRVFEPFFTTKEEGRGTGLGLASVYGTIKNHNGAITLYSEPGHGSSFNIYLPMSKEQAVEFHRSESQPVRGDANILLVDDEEMLRELGKDMLEDLGYKVVCHKGGKAFIQYYRENWEEFDLVILDMVMPEISGRDLFHEMLKINPQVRAMITSGYSINDEAQNMLESGVMGFVGKPFHQSEISEEVAKVLSEKPKSG